MIKRSPYSMLLLFFAGTFQVAQLLFGYFFFPLVNKIINVQSQKDHLKGIFAFISVFLSNTHARGYKYTNKPVHTHYKGTDVKPDSQGKQLGHVTEAVVGQRADLVVTQITAKETTTNA